MSPTNTRVNQSSTSPTARKAGTYQIKVQIDRARGYGWCAIVVRDGRYITSACAVNPQRAIREARRNVRIARKAGGL